MGRGIAALWIAALSCGDGEKSQPRPPPPTPESLAQKVPDYRNCGPNKTYEREMIFIEEGADRTLRFRPPPEDTAWKGDLVLPIPVPPLKIVLEPERHYQVTWNPGCDGRLVAVDPLD